MIALGQALTNADHLWFRLALAEHDFRLTLTQLSMMIEPRVVREIIVISNRFDGQPGKPVQRCLWCCAASGDLLENLQDSFGRHAATS